MRIKLTHFITMSLVFATNGNARVIAFELLVVFPGNPVMCLCLISI